MTVTEVAILQGLTESGLEARIARREFPPANARYGKTRFWTSAFLNAWFDYKDQANAPLNGAEFAELKRDLWRGDTEAVADQVRRLVG